jgi:hypothetical protein
VVIRLVITLDTQDQILFWQINPFFLSHLFIMSADSWGLFVIGSG